MARISIDSESSEKGGRLEDWKISRKTEDWKSGRLATTETTEALMHRGMEAWKICEANFSLKLKA